jgi:hypothetical protein
MGTGVNCGGSGRCLRCWRLAERLGASLSPRFKGLGIPIVRLYMRMSVSLVRMQTEEANSY